MVVLVIVCALVVAAAVFECVDAWYRPDRAESRRRTHGDWIVTKWRRK